MPKKSSSPSPSSWSSSPRARVHAELLENRQLLSGAMPVSAAEEVEPGTLAPTVFVALPSTAIAGAKVKGASALISVTNVAPDDFNGPVTVTLYASLDNDLQKDTDAQIVTTTKKLKVASASSSDLKIKIPSLPNVPDGTYVIIAELVSSVGTGVNASDDGVLIAAPFIDLSGQFASLPGTATKGKKLKASLAVANSGNVTAKGTIPVTIATSTNVDGSGATSIATVNAKVSIKSGASRNVKVSFVVPAEVASGQYFVVATLDPANVIGDKTVTNNTIVSTTVLNVL
jgi:hypothetical protein